MQQCWVRVPWSSILLNVEEFLPRIKLTKAGKIAKRQVISPKKDVGVVECSMCISRSKRNRHYPRAPGPSQSRSRSPHGARFDVFASGSKDYGEKFRAARLVWESKKRLKEAEAEAATKETLQAEFPKCG